MSQQQPTKAYVYQPGGVGERIYGVAGPGTECHTGLKGGWSFRDYRFTKSEAEAVAAYCNMGKTNAPKEIRAAFLKAMGTMFNETSLDGGKKKARKAKQKETPLFNGAEDGTSGAISL